MKRCCSHCDTFNEIGAGVAQMCPTCGHRADVGRRACDCPACRPADPLRSLLPEFFILDRGEPKRVPDALTWARFLITVDRRVVDTQLPGGVVVATYFLGINLRVGAGPPLLFETRVSGGAKHGHAERYASKDEAVAGHQELVKLLRASAENRS